MVQGMRCESRLALGLVALLGGLGACGGDDRREEVVSGSLGGTWGGQEDDGDAAGMTTEASSTTGGPEGSSGVASSTSGGATTTGASESEDEASSTSSSACVPKTCAELGWECGYAVMCGQPLACADEGLTCAPHETCAGGVDAPTQCVASDCPLCTTIPDCSNEPQPTRLRGRVISPGRDDADVDNQVGIPNALVYILRTDSPADIPAMPTGIPTDGMSCDRCEDWDLGPVLSAALTNARGEWEIEQNIPVGVDFILVVQAGKFRRAVEFSIPAEQACETTELPTTLPENPTRLPRHMDDGLAVNIPRIAISTGQIDAIECVFEKMGIAHGEFGNPGDDGSGAPRIHLYRGGSSGSPSGARIDGSTPHDTTLYGDIDRIHSYDMVVADCEGGAWDSSYAERDAHGSHVREFVNRGGRLFASHLSHSWLRGNGTQAYANATPTDTGLSASATFIQGAVSSPDSGPGRIAIDRPNASPRIDDFAEWMVNEGVVASADATFEIADPRSQASALGAHTEEFVYCDANGSGGCSNYRTQQFSFATPYGAPPEDSCGRVSYSGFHVVSAGGSTAYQNVTFPSHCAGSLTNQEKVLLYMLFDLGACVGEPEVPTCTPDDCANKCGINPDGCGGLVDCGSCPTPA